VLGTTESRTSGSQRSERRLTLPGVREGSSRDAGAESHVRSGFLLKKGVINQAYKKRWFVLTTKSLMYFEDQPGEKDAPKGVIPLTVIARVDVKNASNRDYFNVVTPSRVFKLKAGSVPESEAWVAAISGAVEIEKKQNSFRVRRPSRTVLDFLRQEDEAFPADARIHTPAELNKWDSWNRFEVAAFLSTFNMAIHAPRFFNAGINGAKLKQLSTKDLEGMGIKSKEDQLTILKNISFLVKGEIVGAEPMAPVKTGSGKGLAAATSDGK